MESLSKKDYTRANLEFRKAMTNKQATPQTYYEAGITAIALHNDGEAISYLKSAENLAGPTHKLNTDIQLRLAQLALKTRDFKGARDRCKLLLQRNPDFAPAREVLVLALTGLAQPESAEEELQLWLAADPHSQQARMIRSGILVSHEDLPEAIKQMEAAAAQPTHTQATYISLGNLYQVAGLMTKAEQAYTEAQALDRANLEPLRGLGWLYARMGQTDKAVATFRKLADLSPNDGKNRGALAAYYLDRGAWPDAIAELQRLLKENPQDRFNANRLAAVYILSGHLESAKPMIQSLMKSDPTDPQTALLAGTEAFLGGRLDDAILYLNNSLQIKESAQALFFLGASQDRKGNDRQAQAAMTRALQRDPYLLGARLWLADYWLRQSSPATALSLLEKDPLAKNPHPMVRITKVKIYSAMRNYDAATKEMNVLQQETPGVVPTEFDRALRFLIQHKPAQARQALEEGLKKDPAAIHLLVILAQTFIADGMKDRAVERVAQQAGRNPRSSVHFQLLAETQFANSDFASAKASYERAIALSPESPGPLLGLTRTLVFLGKREEAKLRLDALTKRWPQWTQSWTYYGGFMELQNDFPEAVTAYEHAVALDGSNAVALNNLAWRILSDGGDIERARKLAKRARELQENNADYADTLGMILYRQGSRSEAEKELEFALRTQPGNPTFKQHMATISGKPLPPGQPVPR